MKHLLIKIPLLISAMLILSACTDLSREVEKKLNELQHKSESLDSLINKEFDKVLTLDSLINTEGDKVRKLDSLIDKTTSKLDSVTKEKSKLLEKFTK
ncbi:hypothetical protein TBC1_111750 [Lentimicrobium saccharophilum]|uniref:Uncharacterized protein n=1 Tax=Lentimicrobium saccharophilum TaxID=1678841 RepID=A0A0S7BS47_9BACT|nr:hypothetical protein [Lentimicrobium saccharophilum]GAP43594.1 hypothetical protein TBC1_111750 [Lentimicrobium saccharophilum]